MALAIAPALGGRATVTGSRRSTLHFPRLRARAPPARHRLVQFGVGLALASSSPTSDGGRWTAVDSWPGSDRALRPSLFFEVVPRPVLT